MSIEEKPEKANISLPETQEEKERRLNIEAEEIAESEELKNVFAEIDKIKSSDSTEEPEAQEEPQPEVETQEEEAEEKEKDSLPEIEDELPLVNFDKLDLDAAGNEKKIIRSLKKRNYSISAEKIALQKRNAELEKLLNETFNNSVYHHSKNVYNEFERAKAAKKAAIQYGDEDGYIEADIALHKATIAVNDLERLESERKIAHPQPSPVETTQYQSPNAQESYNSSDELNELHNEIIRDWIKERPELDKESKNYNEKLTQSVIEYTNKLDEALINSGQQHQYLSDSYFNNIDNYMNKVKMASAPKTSSMPKPAQTNIPIAAVRTTQNSSPSSTPKKETTKIVLSADEKDWVRQGFLSEKELIKQKMELMK